MSIFNPPPSNLVLHPAQRLTDIVPDVRDVHEAIANCLTIYGLPRAYKIVFTLKEYVTNPSFFTYIDLYSLTTNFGLHYTLGVLAITLGRSIDIQTQLTNSLYSYYQPIVSYSQVKPITVNNFSPELDQITGWFNYSSIDLVKLQTDPSYLPSWITRQEPSYSSFILYPFEPVTFILKLLETNLGVPLSPQLAYLLSRAYPEG